MEERRTSTFTTELKAASDGARTVTARISTIAPDRDGDVVLPRGMDAKNFKKNPVVLFAHDSWSLPVGKVKKLTRDTASISAEVEFAERPDSLPPEQEWLPDTIFDLFKQKILRAFSIGFSVKDAVRPEPKDLARFGDAVKFVIKEWELLELSVVPVPANQEALATAVSKGIDCGGLVDYWGVKAVDTVKAPLTIDRPTLELGGIAPLSLD